jgi:hypothetical protein
MSDIWMQSLTGRAIDLVDPKESEVDFREIADTLAQINRYCGSAVKPCSVAQHTLIACDAAPDSVKPWVLLHDAHEARTTDITTPAQKALEAIAGRLAPEHYIVEQWAKDLMRESIAYFKGAHDIAIHRAAGLPLPNEAMHKSIRLADLIALQTERRDFLSPPPKPWAPEVEKHRPLPKVYRLRAAADVADDLYARFRAYLPALARAHI